MTNYDFTSTKIAKGRFTNERTAEYRVFSLNPNEIRDSKGFSAASTRIPGISHPAEQDGGGDERTIAFTLRFDGDVGYRERRRDDTTISPRIANINDEIAWYRSFIYTEGNARLGDPGAVRPIILFTFGSMYRGLRCKLRSANVTITQLDKDLNPTRADMQILLVEQVQFSVPGSTIWNANTNRGF